MVVVGLVMNLVSLILCRKYRIHMQAIQMFLSASRLCGLCTGEDSNPEDRPRRPETDLERGCPEYTQARRISGENEKAPGRTVFEDARIIVCTRLKLEIWFPSGTYKMGGG